MWYLKTCSPNSFSKFIFAVCVHGYNALETKVFDTSVILSFTGFSSIIADGNGRVDDIRDII